jgi:hypothetical protein
MRGVVTDNLWWAPKVPEVNAALIRRPWRRVALITVGALAVAALLGSATLNPGRIAQVGSRGQVIDPPSMLALSAGCEGLTTWPDFPAENGFLAPSTTPPVLATGEVEDSPFSWRLAPPVSGNFSEAWVGDRAVPPNAETAPRPEQAVALLYRGWTVVWYAIDAPEREVDALLAWARQLPADAEILVAPWPDDAASWRADRVIIATAWRTTQPCETFNGDLLREFDVGTADRGPGPGVDLDDLGSFADMSTAEVLQAERGRG